MTVGRRLDSVGSAVLLAPITIYRRVVSPLIPNCCRYVPSCSNYAARAIRVHGPLRGSALAVWRLLRCNPWSAGGFDPVPGTASQDPRLRPATRETPAID